jgi:hypothetical protein
VKRFQLLEADRRLDVVAQDRLAGVDVAGEHRVDPFPQERRVGHGQRLRSAAVRFSPRRAVLFAAGGRTRHRAPHLLGRFVLAQPLIDDLAQQTVLGPGK